MKTIFKIDLQLFKLNSGNTNVTNDSTYSANGDNLAAENKVYYDKNLLKNAEPELVHDQFGQKRNIPKNNGKEIEFRKFSSLPKALTPLTEGVTPAGNKLDVTAITAKVDQYGDYVVMSDILDLTSIDNVIVEATDMLGSQAGRTLDTVTRNELVTGTNVMYAPKVTTSGTTAVTSRAGLSTDAKLTVDEVFKAVNQLKRMNIKPVDGEYYVCIVHPDVELDIMLSDKWIDINKYSNAVSIFNGEIGRIGKCRFVVSTEAKVWNDKTCPVKSGTAGADGATYYSVYACLFIGKNAYGTTEIEGGGLQTIIKQLGSSGVADALNQRSSVGWKAIKTAKILAQEAIVRVECCSSLSDSSKEN